MLRTAAAAALVALSSAASAQPATPLAWASRLAGDIGSGASGLTRDGYAASAVAPFLAGYAETVARAAAMRESHPGSAAAEAVETSAAALLEKARQHAERAERGLFAVIDPLGTGRADHAEVLARLAAVAERADLDGDGRLDRFEAMVAEAALSLGSDLSREGSARAVAAWLEATW